MSRKILKKITIEDLSEDLMARKEYFKIDEKYPNEMGEMLEYFLDLLIQNQKIKNVANSIINIFILVSFYIMIAGFGAYLQQELNINSMIGSAILAVFCIILFRKNIEGVVKANQILVPILVTTIIFSIYIIKYQLKLKHKTSK